MIEFGAGSKQMQEMVRKRIKCLWHLVLSFFCFNGTEGSPMPTQNSIKVYESSNIDGFQNVFLYYFTKYLWIYNDF